MRALIQRVSSSSVEVSDRIVAKIDDGLLILLGIEADDEQSDVLWLANKIVNMRIFPDKEDVMNQSLLDIKGGMIVVSQFTLHASTKKGNRPSYTKAARPEVAVPLYKAFIQSCESLTGIKIQSGEFGAHMNVALVNDGPVTIWLDSKNKE